MPHAADVVTEHKEEARAEGDRFDGEGMKGHDVAGFGLLLGRAECNA